MNYGVIFPQNEFSHDPASLREYAVTAESLGYDHISIYEHVLGMNPDRPGGWEGVYDSDDPFLEPFVLFAHWAAVTRTIQLMTRVLVLPQRQAPLVAKQAATLDVLSGGRLILGVGVGWNEQEYIGMGSEFKTRGKKVDQQIRLLRRLWTEQHVDYAGGWDVIPNAGINPLPHQRPIPIWLGGHAEATIRRVATLGDGWMPNYPTPEKAAPWLEKLDKALAETGRERSDISIAVRMNFGEGDLDQWASLVNGWKSAGVTHIDLDTMRRGFTDDAQHLEALTTFAGAVATFEKS